MHCGDLKTEGAEDLPFKGIKAIIKEEKIEKRESYHFIALHFSSGVIYCIIRL